MISKGKHCSEHGGLIMCMMILTMNCLVCMKTVLVGKFIHQDSRQKKLKTVVVVGNIYRVPNELSENLQIFNEEFAEI